MKHFTNLNVDEIEIIKLTDYTNIEKIVNGKVKKPIQKNRNGKILEGLSVFKGVTQSLRTSEHLIGHPQFYQLNKILAVHLVCVVSVHQPH